MRNRIWITLTIGVIFMAVAGGCGPRSVAPTTGARGDLNAGYSALDSGNADAAQARADAFLASHPRGVGAAEAHYLRGRAHELRSTKDGANAQQHLQNARLAYLEALKHSPNTDLEPRIRASIGNVAYFQDDYNTALAQLNYAAERLPDAESQAWALYRSGICHQRLGRFAMADKVFDQVQTRFPQYEPARRARAHRGMTSFSVQLAAYQDNAAADQLVNEVRRQGLAVIKTRDTKGLNIVSIVNIPSYDEAKRIKARFSAEHPDAIIP